MTVESSQVFPVVEQDSQEPDSLNQENLFGSAGEGEHEALQQPGETFFPEPLFGGGTGSVLDPNGGVLKLRAATQSGKNTQSRHSSNLMI